MKLFNKSILLLFLILPLMSCIDEPAQPANEQEIIKEISREWTCNMDEEGFPIDFNAVISADPIDDTRVLISNFHKIGTNLTVSVIVHKDLTLEIPEQIVNNQVFKGSGIVSDDYTQITWTYSIENDNGDIVQVTGKYSYGISS